MDSATKSKRAPRKKTVTVSASVVTAITGTHAVEEPFVDTVESTSIPPLPPTKAKRGAKKPPVIAAVTPDGIQGTLTPVVEQRPLITHLPIHITSEEDTGLFTAAGGSDGVQQPCPFDPEESFATFQGRTKLEESLSATAAASATPTIERTILPLHYSEKLMVRFQDANREQCLPDQTDVACFWDCHTFRGPPCVIPMKIETDIWHVYGNFCCPECATAFLFKESLDTHVKWERYALLNRLYAGGGADGIRLAPPRTVLRLFGGSLDISEYRTITAEKRMRIDVTMPPMISITQIMDTKPFDFYDASVKNSFIPWEMDRMNRPGAQGLRLRRTKPVAEKESTLEWCMGIAPVN
jgi:hypothetical protein